MAATLPRPTQLKLEQTLGQWQHWQLQEPVSTPPQVVDTIDGGYSNHSVLVRVGELHYVVRINGEHSNAAAGTRQAEWRATQLASRAGLAPAPRYHNPELGSLVCDYLPHDADQQHTAQQVGTLLRRIHSLPPLHARLDLRERIRRYQRHIQQCGRQLPPLLVQLETPVTQQLEALQSADHAPVLCHNDLLVANRLRSGGQLYALDWEYSAMGDPWFDLAVTAAGDELDATQLELLLSAYLEGPPGDAEYQRLRRWMAVYRFLELLWYCAIDDAAIRSTGISERRLQQLQQAMAVLSP